MRRTPRSLIPNEGYEIGWVKGRPFFNQPPPPVTVIGPNGAPVTISAPQPNQNPTNDYPWVSRGYSIVIPQNISTQVPLLLEDNYRNLLLLQNNSVATSPDTAPNLFIALDGPVQSIQRGTNTFPFNAISLAPGEGLLLDTRIFGNALYFAWGAFVNTGNTAVVFGMCIYGRTLNSPPLQAQASGYMTMAPREPVMIR